MHTRLAFALLSTAALTGVADAHCEIPCGIYDDATRFRLLKEHTRTIGKSAKSIRALSGERQPNHNQVVRWVLNKERHATELRTIVVDYFLAQRIKPPAQASDESARARYLATLAACHRLIRATMKAKQTTDAEAEHTLGREVASLERLYFGPKQLEHLEHEHGEKPKNAAGVEWLPKVSFKQFCRTTPGVHLGHRWSLTKETTTHYEGAMLYAESNSSRDLPYVKMIRIPKSSKPPIDLTKHGGGLVVLEGKGGDFRVLGWAKGSLGVGFFVDHKDHRYQGK